MQVFTLKMQVFRELQLEVRAMALHPILPFPILLQILNHLPRNTLVTLLRVNSVFHWAALPHLYKRITLSTKGPWPLFRTGVPPPPEGSDFSAWLERNPLESLVEQVDILPHATTRCMTVHFALILGVPGAPRSRNTPEMLPFLPRLKTLRVHTYPSGLHVDETTRFAAETGGGLGLIPQCAVISNLRPRKLVLVGAPSVSSTGLTSLPYDLLAAVDEYVLVLFPDLDLLTSDRNSFLPLFRASAIGSELAHVNCAQHATIIFYPHTPWNEFKCSNSVKMKLADSWAGRFFGELGRQLSQLGDRTKIKLVNAGSIDHNALGMETWDPEEGQNLIENHLREAFRLEQLDSFKSVRRTFARSRQVDFVTMDQYLAEIRGREDELGPARVQEWLTPGAKSIRRRVPASPRVIPPSPHSSSHRDRTPSGSKMAAAAHAAARKMSDKVATEKIKFADKLKAAAGDVKVVDVTHCSLETKGYDL